MNGRIDNSVCVPKMLRTEVSMFEKEVEPPPPEGRREGVNTEGMGAGQPVTVEDDARRKSLCHV